MENNFKYKLSIIIPYHKSLDTMGMLLDSIVNNDLSKDEYEIIIVDDNSEDNIKEIIKSYEEKANIVFCNTETEIHCPGNTRQVGLEKAQGEWITFADHDDYFEPDIFSKVFKNIETEKVNTVLQTSFYGTKIDFEEKEIYEANDETIPWMHGKFYNHQMLIDGNINFKKDLITHEDVYFNNIIQIYLHQQNKVNYFAPYLYTYNWVNRQESTSHQHEGNILFMDKHFKDFIYVNSEPFFELSNEEEDYKRNNLLSNFLLFYFFYQLGKYRLHEDYPKENLIAISDIKNRILKELNITNEELIEILYSDPIFYNNLKEKTFTAISIPFIEEQSLKDFINNLKE